MTTTQNFQEVQARALRMARQNDCAVFVRKTRSGYTIQFDGRRACGAASPDGTWSTKADLAHVGIR